MRVSGGFALLVLTGAVFTGCGGIQGSYDELVSSGKAENTARKRYSSFLKTVQKLDKLKFTGADEDSRIIKQASKATDKVINDLKKFPSTLESRIAFDALAYSAEHILDSPSFGESDVNFFWRNALVDPLLLKVRDYLEESKPNDSTHLQIVLGARKALGSELNDEMLTLLMPVVGPSPSDAVMEACEKDSLVLKKINDLIFYSRSLQKVSPPLWMCTGPWFVAVEMEGWPKAFFCVKPYIAGKEIFLSFRSYNYPEIYLSLFGDNGDSFGTRESWFAEVKKTIDGIKVDSTFAKKISENEPPTFDCHFFYDDHLLSIDERGDKVDLSFKLQEIRGSGPNIMGMDSIRVTLDSAIPENISGLYRFDAFRYRGETIIGDRREHAKKASGKAYMFPFGMHSYDLLNQYRELTTPKMNIKVQ